MKSGIYLRKRAHGAMEDPTMRHVDDPQAFHVDEYVRLESGIHLITHIDDAVFGKDDTRFAHLIKTHGRRIKDAVIHDVREAR